MSSLPEVTLFVKAGADGKRYGACPFCQRIFMILLIKAKNQQLRFKVATVNVAKPPEDFKKVALRRVPAIAHNDNATDNVDDIVQYLDEVFPTETLYYENSEAEKACKDIFQKFCFFIKEVAKDSSLLVAELSKLNNYLLSSQTKFLCADHVTHLDCEVLPKLHHARVASKTLKGFEFPSNMDGLWRYLKNAYNEESFIKSCPSNQEITIHWADKPETPSLSLEQHAYLTKSEPQYTLSVPSENSK